MADQVQGEDTPAPANMPHCPWCSATMDTVDAARCPSCNAQLREESAAEVPGVTRVDLEKVLTSRKPPPRQSGLMGWLSGSYPEEVDSPDAQREVSPPDEAVRREMIRMEIAAIEARVEAERAELAAERSIVLGANAAVEPAAVSDAAAPPADPPVEGSGPS
ncbi:MAG: hypothetical protein ABI573_09950 [Chloroflexota bacterium]